MPEYTNGMQALVEYGYVKTDDGVMYSTRRPHSQSWQPVEGGFLRFDLGEIAVAPGHPPQIQRVPIPWKMKDSFRRVSGLDWRLNPDCFEWVWPEPEVAKIYAVAREQELATRRTDKDPVPVVRDEPIPEKDLVAMVHAQQPEPEEPAKHWWQR